MQRSRWTLSPKWCHQNDQESLLQNLAQMYINAEIKADFEPKDRISIAKKWLLDARIALDNKNDEADSKVTGGEEGVKGEVAGISELDGEEERAGQRRPKNASDVWNGKEWLPITLESQKPAL